MKYAGVIGHPIAQSLSPVLHHHWLKKYNIDGAYNAYDVMVDDLGSTLKNFQMHGFTGVNVTIPHKKNAMDFCTTLTRDAEKIGAVNVLRFLPNNEIEGHNTDAYGFLENLKSFTNVNLLSGKKALVIGAGGAARGVASALQPLNLSEIRVVNRTLDSAEDLSDDFSLKVFEWHDMDDALKDCDLVINTTSCGMNGQNDLNINLDLTSQNAIIYDIVYKPLETKLLRDARQKNRKIIDGLGMLIHQARPSFQSFFGMLPDESDEVRKILACAL